VLPHGPTRCLLPSASEEVLVEAAVAKTAGVVLAVAFVAR
tara:strand:- start:1077 stop:1196 length:120 start_codon:yes stop_codon:yes gene_type:complete